MSPTDGTSPAPIDRPILEYLCERLATVPQCGRVELTDEEGHLELRVALADRYYPASVAEATLFVRWYTNDDFTIHYREQHQDGEWECRWDRHPNPHNTRPHFHPPPDASTPGEDRTLPRDYRDVVQLVFDDIESRIRTLWSQ
jgi:hypothetical protein